MRGFRSAVVDEAISLDRRTHDPPLFYMQTDRQENLLRIGECDNLWARYRGGTAYTLCAAGHGYVGACAFDCWATTLSHSTCRSCSSGA